MCGIAAWVPKKHPTIAQRHTTLANIISTIQPRGSDSWGVCRIEPDGAYKLVKRTGRAISAFMRWETYNELVHEVCNRKAVYLLHTRAATVGDVTKRNAHPFVRGRWVVVHNGWVTNHHEIAKKLGVDESAYEVDSEVIALALGMGKRELLKEMYGAFAVLAVNMDEPTKLYVNAQSNPLKFQELANGDYIFTSTAIDTDGTDVKKAKEMAKGVVFDTNTGTFSECDWFNFGERSKVYIWDENFFCTTKNKSIVPARSIIPKEVPVLVMRRRKKPRVVKVKMDEWKRYITNLTSGDFGGLGSLVKAIPVSNSTTITYPINERIVRAAKNSSIVSAKVLLTEDEIAEAMREYRMILAKRNWDKIIDVIFYLDEVCNATSAGITYVPSDLVIGLALQKKFFLPTDARKAHRGE